MRCVGSYQDIPADPRDKWFDEEDEQEEIEMDYEEDVDNCGMDCVDRWKYQHGEEF